VAALALLALWPARRALVADEILGAGPDVISTLWGMWWFSQEWLGAAWGGWSDLANHPYGAFGAVLSPTSAAVWSLTHELLGIGRASALAGAAQVGGLAIATCWLAHRLGVGALGSFAAGLVPLGLRITWYGLGEGSVVTIAGLFIPLGLIGLVGLSERSGLGDAGEGRRAWTATALLAVSGGLAALENPYLAPVLPACIVAALAAGSLRRPRERARLLRLGVALVSSLLLIGAVSVLFGRAASPDYPPRVVEESRALLGWTIDVIDKPWARVDPAGFLVPSAVRWTLNVRGGEDATGGDYLGLAPTALLLVGVVLRPRKTAPWLVFGLAGLSLSVGSIVGGVPGPFLLFNALLDLLARPLTQPSRYLVLYGIGAGLCAGWGVAALTARLGGRVAAAAVALLAIEGLSMGGLGLDLPTTALPDADCLRDLPDEPGGVLIWPGDASRWEGDLERVWLLQMLHERPAVHPGIASWALHRQRARDVVREQLGFRYVAPVGEPLGSPAGQPDRGRLAELGFRWVVVDIARDPRQTTWAEGVFGPPLASCTGAAIHQLLPDG